MKPADKMAYQRLVRLPSESSRGKQMPKENVKRLLCYLGFWVTGIIFLVIEKRDRLVSFHAMQSLVTFGILNIIWGVALSIRSWAGAMVSVSGSTWSPTYIATSVLFFSFFALWWLLWAVLLYKTSSGWTYRVPIFADLTDIFLGVIDKDKSPPPEEGDDTL